MTPIEKLKQLEQAATPGPWQTRFLFRAMESARRDPKLLTGGDGSRDWADSELMETLRNLATELIGLWEAANAEVDSPEGISPGLLRAIDALNAAAEKEVQE